MGPWFLAYKPKIILIKLHSIQVFRSMWPPAINRLMIAGKVNWKRPFTFKTVKMDSQNYRKCWIRLKFGSFEWDDFRDSIRLMNESETLTEFQASRKLWKVQWYGYTNHRLIWPMKQIKVKQSVNSLKRRSLAWTNVDLINSKLGFWSVTVVWLWLTFIL